MSKKEKKINSIEKTDELVKDESITSAILEDENEIEEPFTEVEEKTQEIIDEPAQIIDSEPIAETKKDDVITTKKSHKTLFIISFAVIAVILLFLVFSTIFGSTVGYKTTIIHGIKIKDIDVSGLSKEEAIAKVTSAFQEKLEKQITLKHNEYEITVFPGQFDVSFAIEEAVNMAYEKGRTRKYFSK